MEISAFIYKLYTHLGLIFLLVVIKVSGELFQRHRQTTFAPERKNHVTVYKGETAVLTCGIRNLGPKTVAWRKVSEDFPISVGRMMYAPNDEMSIDYQQIDHMTHVNLVIKKTLPSHSGKYECQLISSEIQLHHVTLTVLKKRPVFKQSIFLDGSVYLSPKQRLNLTCNSTGSSRAPEFIDWFHDGNLIDERRDNWRNRAEIFNYKPEVPGRSLISQLTIEHVEPKDAGVYVCRSMTPSVNSGVDTTSITVHILNAEKDHMKKREGGGHTKVANELMKGDKNRTFRIQGCYYVVLLAMIFQIFS
ncbi:kin of IRRE-like protein 1 [Mytilus galloprovincialis]|uniref:kin of IRRE-like protein 1 n=1 Tax=Mytilus galloprovincialis TaxID=29158 RepID=UPI003F7BC5CB